MSGGGYAGLGEVVSEKRALAITYEPFHDNSTVRAFYGTLDEAKAEAVRLWGAHLGEDTLDIFDENGRNLAVYSDYELVGDTVTGHHMHTGRYTWRDS